MQLNSLKRPKGSRNKKRIIGRGKGSGRGETAGRGENGQKSRSGRWCVKASEGGQIPLIRRLPKVGFRSHRPIVCQIVNVEALNRFHEKELVNAQSLKEKGFIKSLNKPFKLLGQGELKKALTVEACYISKTAKAKIEQAGGELKNIEAQPKKEKVPKK